MKTLQQKRGNWAELKALEYMKSLGLRLVETNYRCLRGEIDIIGWDGHVLVFAEVRYRSKSTFGQASETVNHSKQRKTIIAAQRFLQQNPLFNAPCRFDVLALDDTHSINWIRDAYTL